MITEEWMKKYEAVKELLECDIDLDSYFTEKEIDGKKVDTLDIGTLYFSSGIIIACDIFAEPEDVLPFIQAIPTGTYPVKACVVPNEKYGNRYACIKVEISDQKPVRYELAMTGDEIIDDDMEQGSYYGYGVDGGIATMMDAKTYEAFQEYWIKFKGDNKYINPYGSIFCDLLEENAKKNPKYQHETGDWLNWTVPGTDYNLIIFSTGWGDGDYPVYYGYDAEGKMCGVYSNFINIAESYNE